MIIYARMKEWGTLRTLLSRRKESGGAVACTTTDQVDDDVPLAKATPEAARELEGARRQFNTYCIEMGIDLDCLRSEASSAEAKGYKAFVSRRRTRGLTQRT